VLSSAKQTSYVLSYADHVTNRTSLLADDKTDAQRITTELPKRSESVKPDADPEILLEIVKLSDEAGKGQAFKDARDHDLAVRGFFDDERGPLTSRITNATQKQLAEGGVQNADVGNTVSFALRDGVDKQLEKRLREVNDAHLLIERHKGSLGASNVAAVQKLADDVAVASYLSHIALLEDKNELSRLIHERSSVESTINDAIEAEKSFQSEKARNDAERRASEQRVSELTKSRDAIPQAVTNAETASQNLDKAVEQARKDYEDALKNLESQIEARKKS
jgi:hypothetical protein